MAKEKFLVGWTPVQKALFLGALFVFWAQGFWFSFNHGNRAFFHTDETGEQFTLFAANRYVDHGFTENFLLPTYPPFGRDPSGKNRTEPFVYTHYLAGQDLVLGTFIKIFGKDATWAGRLIPLTLTTAALGWLTVEFGLWMGSVWLGILFFGLMLLPRSITAWAICFYGHSYVMAFLLLLLAGMLFLTRVNWNTGKKKQAAWTLGFLGGVAQMFFDLDWVPMTFLATGAFALLLQPELRKEYGARVFLGYFLGACAAFVYQVTIGALYLGSFKRELEDLFQWLFWRAGKFDPKDGIPLADLRIHKMWHLFNNTVYGGTGWTALNLVFISLTFIVLGWLSRVRNWLETKHLFLGLVFAFVGAVIWTALLRQHAYVHMRFIHRHAIALYVFMLFVAISVGKDLVKAARRK